MWQHLIVILLIEYMPAQINERILKKYVSKTRIHTVNVRLYFPMPTLLLICRSNEKWNEREREREIVLILSVHTNLLPRNGERKKEKFREQKKNRQTDTYVRTHVRCRLKKINQHINRTFFSLFPPCQRAECIPYQQGGVVAPSAWHGCAYLMTHSDEMDDKGPGAPLFVECGGECVDYR